MSPSNKKNHGKAKTAASTSSRTPNASPPLDALPPAPTTCITFHEFVELADLQSIKQFLDTAASSPEGENLKILWARAFKEGLIVGHQLYGKTEEKLNEAHNSGYEAGYDEGRRDEQGDWIIEGHGEHCGFQPTVVHNDSAVQTENGPPPRPTATAAVQVDAPNNSHPRLTSTAAIQVDAPKPTPPRSVTTMAVQVDIPKPLPTPRSTPNAANSAVQTTPLGTQDAGSQTSPHPDPIHDPVCITSPPSLPLSWADDVASLPISTLPISSPPIPLLPNLPSSPPPRDLSILRSSTAKPFLSLQRRNNRSRAHFSQPLRNQQPFIPYQAFSRRRFPPPRAFSTSYRPDQVYPHHTSHFLSSALNWESDPRLFKLSQALSALGWVRP